MKFKPATGNQVNMTHLQGYVNCTYAELKAVFGKEHSDGDGYKVDAEWMLAFDDGTVATVYNWKNGKNYCGRSGTPKTKITDWHIGGHNANAVKCVEKALGLA